MTGRWDILKDTSLLLGKAIRIYFYHKEITKSEQMKQEE